MTINAFIGESVAEMIRAGISVKFVKRKKESKNAGCYFIPPPFSEFVIHYYEHQKPDEWIYNFIHEFCHFIQYRDEFEKWSDASDAASTSFCDFFDNKSRKKLSKKYIRRVQEMEVDCGIKVFNLIKEKRLKIDIKRYFKENNLYILCHPFMVKYRKFDIPYTYTTDIERFIPKKRPITMADIDNYKHYEKLDFCFLLAYGNKYKDFKPL
jgi:hypothetical protein